MTLAIYTLTPLAAFHRLFFSVSAPLIANSVPGGAGPYPHSKDAIVDLKSGAGVDLIALRMVCWHWSYEQRETNGRSVA